MKRLFKILAITALVLVVLLVAGVWLLNRWLRSPAMHAHVEAELSKALRMPLRFQSIDLSLWNGLEARGITVPGAQGNFFEATTFSARHRLLPLLRGRLVLGELQVEAPRFFLVQQADGSWKVPQTPKVKKPEVTEPKEKKPETPKPGLKPTKEPDVIVESILIAGGRAELVDKEGKPFLTASGLRVKLRNQDTETYEGRVTIDRIVMHGYAALAEVKAGVSHSKKGLFVPDFAALMGGGAVECIFSSKPEKAGDRVNVKLQVREVDLARAAHEAGAKPPELTGILGARVELRGYGDQRKTYTGKGVLTLRDGTCKEIDMVNDIGALLSLDEAAKFTIREARAEVQLAYERLTIQPLTIQANPLALRAEGTARLDGKMELAAVLGADPQFLAKQAGSLVSQFTQEMAGGLKGLPFQVTGTLTKPRTNLREMITGTKNKNLQKAILIDAALGGLLEEKEKPAATPPAEPKPAQP